MTKRISQIVIAAIAIGAISVVGMWLQARPADSHPFFGINEFNVIAHRGGRGLGPENTLAVFQLSLEKGADILEMDVRSTSDNHLIVLHDATVDRTTNGSGTANEMSLIQLKKLDAGYRWSNDGGKSYPFKNRGITIPTLSEVFKAIDRIRLIIEIKENQPIISQRLCSEIRHHRRIPSVLVASIHSQVLNKFRTICPDVATAASPSEAMWFFYLSRIGLTAMYSPQENALLVPKIFKGRQVITNQFLSAAHHRHLKVAVWTVNSKKDMRKLIAMGVDGIITDYPERLVKIFKNKKYPMSRITINDKMGEFVLERDHHSGAPSVIR
jgi:glycerophosphoryl diester phosphodiesterase